MDFALRRVPLPARAVARDCAACVVLALVETPGARAFARMRSFSSAQDTRLRCPNLALGAGACTLLFCAVTVLLSSTMASAFMPPDKHRMELIINATRENNLPELLELLWGGAAGEDVATEVAYALLTAAEKNKIPALKMLLASRNEQRFYWRDIRLKDLSPLLLAAKHEHCEAVQLLLSHNANYARHHVNVLDDEGQTALSWSAGHGNPACVRALMNAGADVNHVNAAGFTPLHSAARHNDVKLAQLLLRNGADVNTAGKDGFTALHNAIYSDNYAVAELLLRRGAAVDARHNGSTALHIAADKGFVDVARLLLRHGAAFDGHAGSTGFTPMDYAVENDDDAMVEALLEEAALVTKTRARVDMLVQAGNSCFVAFLCWLCYRLMLWQMLWQFRPRRIVTARRGRAARAAPNAWSLLWRFLKLLLQCLKCAVAAVWSIVWRWPALLACAVWALLRLPRRAPPTPSPASPAAQPPTTARGVRRRRQQRRGMQQVAPPADDAARAAGATRAETRSNDGAADERDVDAAVMQQTADEIAALKATEAAAAAAKEAAAKEAAETAAAKQAAEAAAADEAANAAARQRAPGEAAAEEALAVAAKAALAAAEAAAAEETAAAAARVQALEAAAAAEKAGAEKAAAESAALPPAGDHRPAAEAPLPTPLPTPLLKECCVCLSDMPTSELLVIGPCGHRCLCSECWQNLQPPTARRCPICSVVATTAMRVYEAWA